MHQYLNEKERNFSHAKCPHSLPKHTGVAIGRSWQAGSCSLTAAILCACFHSSLHNTVLISMHWFLLGLYVIPSPSHKGKRYKHINGMKDDLHNSVAPSKERPLMIS